MQQDTLGHRGRRHDPLYRSRKLLAMAAERLDDNGSAKRRGLLAGDPNGEVAEAWRAKECLRDLYTFDDDTDFAGRGLDALTEDCREAKAAEVRGMAGTLKRWRNQILAWHATGASNGPTEGLNSLIKKDKRVAAGFRSFTNTGYASCSPSPATTRHHTPLKREGGTASKLRLGCCQSDARVDSRGGRFAPRSPPTPAAARMSLAPDAGGGREPHSLVQRHNLFHVEHQPHAAVGSGDRAGVTDCDAGVHAD